MNTLDFLEAVQRAAAQGYLFHGSPLKLDVVEPHQAYDLSHIGGCQCAVYATDDPFIALMCSVLHRNSKLWYSAWSVQDGSYSLQLHNVTLSGGWIYLVRREQFSPVPDKSAKYISLVACEPAGIIQTCVEQLALANFVITYLTSIPDHISQQWSNVDG